jgi:hypothetical protein
MGFQMIDPKFAFSPPPSECKYDPLESYYYYVIFVLPILCIVVEFIVDLTIVVFELKLMSTVKIMNYIEEEKTLVKPKTIFGFI